MKRFTTSWPALASALVLAGALGACTEDPVSTPPPTGIPVPTAYSFQSRFDSTTSSVSYEGQVVRNLLLQDLTAAIAGLAKPGAAPVSEADLLALYEHSDAANLMTRTSVTGKELLERQFNRISTGKKLSDKISPAQVIGFNGTADALVRDWIRQAAANAADPSKLGTPEAIFDANGLDIPEILGKVLMGAVSYYQATSVYLTGIPSKDNATAAAGSGGAALPYTVMEHNWDEAFGYFGAARNFASYTDADLASSTNFAKDANGDGKIDLTSEYNYSFARYAARRDNANLGTDFTKEIFDGFLKGRTAITNKGTNDAILAERAAISSAWEKMIAATVLHYANDVTKGMAKVGTAEENITSLRHVWSELKGYLVVLQFNSMKAISDAQLQQLHTLIGSVPVVSAPSTAEHTQYLANLDTARAILKSVYGFSDAQIAGW